MIRLWLSQLAGLSFGTHVLLKISLILTLGWLLHFALRAANPRWRVLLWRGMALGTIAVPFISLALPFIRISIARPAVAPVVMVQPDAGTQSEPSPGPEPL